MKEYFNMLSFQPWFIYTLFKVRKNNLQIVYFKN